MKYKEKFIVIEGTDGAGKTTQIKLLEKALKKIKKSYKVIDFPRYKDNEYGKLIFRYLLGEFGKLEQVSPYLASLPYAGDRLLAKPEIEKWLKQGQLVIANRYASANKGHMSAKLPVSERKQFVDWLNNLEYKINEIPREDLVILLFLDPKLAQKNINTRARLADIHEKDFNYQKKVAKAFLELSKSEKNWVVVNCAKNGKMKKPQEIHEEISGILKRKNIL
ncbi:MAG: dTMP kinase [Candidatus Daviesbacteria bacterium]|nr:dTMP kinase [Candidatus Daviesbacteria bacterium]